MSLTADLCRDFPTLYGPGCGLEAPDGWRDIMYRLSERLKTHSLRVLQVKEKFGSLRFYYGGGDDTGEIEAAIMEAEDSSFVTCDVCGAPHGNHSKERLRS